jgi:hypothetical protein
LENSDSASPKRVHKREDYDILQEKDLAQEMIDDILARTEAGLSLSREQMDALGLSPKFKNFWLLPNSDVPLTESQMDATFGSKEHREKILHQIIVDIVKSQDQRK